MCVVKATHVNKSLPRYADINDVEIRCNKATTIVFPSEDDNDIPVLDFNFTPIPDIERMPKDSVIGT
jgi:hypothetical protein